jgi:vanillate/4-hydroxybenzoate decarboxylase subunit D
MSIIRYTQFGVSGHSRHEASVQEAPPLGVVRELVPGVCPECGADALRRYPVIAEIGWEIVTKCQRCLFSVSREPWRRLGPIELLIDRIDAE